MRVLDVAPISQGTGAAVWNHPIDVHLGTDSLRGWPRMLIEVRRDVATNWLQINGLPRVRRDRRDGSTDAKVRQSRRLTNHVLCWSNNSSLTRWMMIILFGVALPFSLLLEESEPFYVENTIICEIASYFTL